MRIQILSDLHLEFLNGSSLFNKLTIPVTGDILVLAGDTIYLNDIRLEQNDFWDWAAKNYKQVLIVPGNHEYYNYGDIAERGLYWQWMIRHSVGYYQNQIARIDNVDFILSTLWSHISPTEEYIVYSGLNDFHQTMYDGKMLTVAQYNEWNQKCFDFIKSSVEASDAEKIVVVTHHLPSYQVVATEHKLSVLSSAFANEYADYIENSRIDAWIYGHSHTNIDALIGNTQVVSNQLGYLFRNEHLKNGFEAGKFITI